MNNTDKKQGFTLIQLALTIVIIGIIASGVLLANSMISSSKVNSTIAQITEIDAATGSFVSKFNALPGDSTAHGGDGDGMVTRMTWPGIAAKDVNLVQCEIANYFFNIMPDVYQSSTCAAAAFVFRSSLSTRMPKTKMGIKDGFIMASSVAQPTWPTWAPDLTDPKVYYALLSPYNYPSCFNCNDFSQGAYNVMHDVAAGNRSVTPSDAAALDQKFDDGIANTGKVIAGNVHNFNSGITRNALATCSSGAKYLVNNTGYQCTPLIEVGVTQNALQ